MKPRALHHANLHHAGHHLSKSKPAQSANYYEDPAFSSDPSAHPLYAADRNDRWTTSPPAHAQIKSRRRRRNRRVEDNSGDFAQPSPPPNPPYSLHDTSPQSSVSSSFTVVSTSDETRVSEEPSLSQGSIDVSPTEDTAPSNKSSIGKSKGFAALFHRRKQPMTASQDTIAASEPSKETLPPPDEPSLEASSFSTQREGSGRHPPMPQPLFENFPAQPERREPRLVLDSIDELDETNPLGLYLHHGGPYEAIYKVTGVPRRSDLHGKGGSRDRNPQKHSRHTGRNLHPHERSFKVSPGEIFPSESGFSRSFTASQSIKERHSRRDASFQSAESYSQRHPQPFHDAGPRINQAPRTTIHDQARRPPEDSFYLAEEAAQHISSPRAGDIDDDDDDDFYLVSGDSFRTCRDTMGDSMSAPTSTPPSFQSHRNSPNVYAQPPMSAPSILVTFHPDAGASREELYEPPPHPGPIRLPNTPPPLSDRETRTRRSQDYRPTNFHPPYAYSVPSHAGSVASSYRSLSSKSSAVPSVHSRSTQSSTTGPRPLHLPKRLVMPAPLQPSVASSRSRVRSSRPPAQVQDMGMRERLPPPIAAPRPPYYGPPANRPQVIPIGPNGPNRLRKRPSEAVHASVPRTAPPVPSVPSTSLFAHVAHHQTAAGTNKPQPSFHVKADKTGKKVLAKRRT